MRSALRLIGLLTVARVRAAGWTPWLVYAGWMLFAMLQEPLMLRRHGIYLLDDAAWVGGLVLAMVLLCAEARRPRRLAVAGNLVLLLGLAVVQTAGAAVLDLSYLSAGLSERLWQGLAFFVAWAPLTVMLARPLPGPIFARFLAIIGVLAALAVGSMLAVRLRGGADSLALVAAGVATLASCLPTPESRK